MADETMVIEALESRARRRDERRDFFRSAFGAVAVAGAGAAAMSIGSPAQAQTAALTDADILNFALNLEYLEAQFYNYAVTGQGLPANLLTGSGQQGAVIGGQKVNFTDPVVAAYAKEIAGDEVAHVAFLRTALGTSAVAQPAIDVGGTDPNGAFSNAARAAGLVGPGVAFNPYADDESFLLGAFIFEDVGVTAYKGAAPLITSKMFLEAAAGILAVEAYHAGLVRTVLYRKGIDTRLKTDAISNARDSLDGTPAIDRVRGIGPDDDQGVTGDATTSNIAPLNENGLAYSRTPGQVLNIAYLNPASVDRGGFFPAGVNGTIKLSAAN